MKKNALVYSEKKILTKAISLYSFANLAMLNFPVSRKKNYLI